MSRIRLYFRFQALIQVSYLHTRLVIKVYSHCVFGMIHARPANLTDNEQRSLFLD